MSKQNLMQALKRGSTEPTYEVVSLPKPKPGPSFSSDALNQKLADTTRDERAAMRRAARDEATNAEWRYYLDNYSTIADDVKARIKRRHARSARVNSGGTLLAHVTDVHFGSRVRRDNHTYDINVAARRLAAFAEEILNIQIQTAATSLVICFTGDMFDSRIGKWRTDKILSQEGPAVFSYMCGLEIIKQFIDELIDSSQFESVSISGVAGNESRLTIERGHSDDMACENWDSLLNASLAVHYRDTPGVSMDFAVNRYVVEVEGWRVLLMHGDQGLSRQIDQKETQSILGMHNCDFGLSGHVHDPRITGHWIRSGSIMGTDSYAGEGMNLSGVAAQAVIHLTTQRRNVHIIDLQDCDNVEGYDIIDFAGAFGSAGL